MTSHVKMSDNSYFPLCHISAMEQQKITYKYSVCFARFLPIIVTKFDHRSFLLHVSLYNHSKTSWSPQHGLNRWQQYQDFYDIQTPDFVIVWRFRFHIRSEICYTNFLKSYDTNYWSSLMRASENKSNLVTSQNLITQTVHSILML